MTTKLEDYDEMFDICDNSEQLKIELAKDELFPEMWELEMEVLQVENNLNTELTATHSFRDDKVEEEIMLEDYADSEDEVESTAENGEPDKVGNSTFPTMWELELEILSANEITGELPSGIDNHSRNNQMNKAIKMTSSPILCGEDSSCAIKKSQCSSCGANAIIRKSALHEAQLTDDNNSEDLKQTRCLFEKLMFREIATNEESKIMSNLNASLTKLMRN